MGNLIPHWAILRTEVPRIDSQCHHFTDESWGEVSRIEIQWLGLHVAFEIARTPPKLTEAETAANRARLRSFTEA
ncbi:hypothetical protein [Novosphingobium sp. 9]|uniref:hypothetical protein n=1 Tax=Novosphingobium sp. 9 TaxID=2025349 RepID=UPI0021B6506B|nr:hypothetical protein [Novosphingobium sp. 9]